MSVPCQPSLPAAPLLARIGALRISDIRWSRARTRMMHSGRVTFAMADRICVHVLSVHPCAVYGAAWWAEVEGEAA